MNRKIKKILISALAFLVAFSGQLEAPLYAQMNREINSVTNRLVEDATAIRVPKEIGEVEEIFRGNENRFIVLVQDAHSIPDAQNSIRGLLNFFRSKYEVDLTFVEGSSTELNPQFFRSFPDTKLLKKVFEKYLHTGELTGTTAAALFNEKESHFVGIENWDLYEDEIGFFLKAVANEKESLKQLQKYFHELNEVKEKHYSKDLLEVDRAITSFRQNKSDLTKLIKTLVRFKEPLAESRIEALWHSISQDESIVSLEVEVKSLASRVRKALLRMPPTPGLYQDQEIFNLEYQRYRTSKSTAEVFGLMLKKLIEKYQMPLEISSQLDQKTRFQKRMQDIKGTQIFSELESYIASVKRDLFENPLQSQLNEENKYLELIEDLVKLELSQNQWIELISMQKDFDVWIEKPTEGIQYQSVRRLLKDLEANIRFYEIARQRDVVFAEKALLEMSHRNRKQAVLVAGGFHTEGLMSALKSKGISYALVTPKIRSLPEENHYRDHMKGDVSWKDYFEVENGKVNLYKAFARGTRDLLLKESKEDSGILLKRWRDQIIRDMANQGQIEQASQYLALIDEVSKTDHQESELKKKWLSSINEFMDRVGALKVADKLNEQNVLKLIQPATAAEAVLANAFSRNELRVDLLPSLSVSLSSIDRVRFELRSQFEHPATSHVNVRFALQEAVKGYRANVAEKGEEIALTEAIEFVAGRLKLDGDEVDLLSKDFNKQVDQAFEKGKKAVEDEVAVQIAEVIQKHLKENQLGDNLQSDRYYSGTQRGQFQKRTGKEIPKLNEIFEIEVAPGTGRGLARKGMMASKGFLFQPERMLGYENNRYEGVEADAFLFEMIDPEGIIQADSEGVPLIPIGTKMEVISERKVELTLEGVRKEITLLIMKIISTLSEQSTTRDLDVDAEIANRHPVLHPPTNLSKGFQKIAAFEKLPQNSKMEKRLEEIFGQYFYEQDKKSKDREGVDIVRRGLRDLSEAEEFELMAYVADQIRQTPFYYSNDLNKKTIDQLIEIEHFSTLRWELLSIELNLHFARQKRSALERRKLFEPFRQAIQQRNNKILENINLDEETAGHQMARLFLLLHLKRSVGFEIKEAKGETYVELGRKKITLQQMLEKISKMEWAKNESTLIVSSTTMSQRARYLQTVLLGILLFLIPFLDIYLPVKLVPTLAYASLAVGMLYALYLVLASFKGDPFLGGEFAVGGHAKRSPYEGYGVSISYGDSKNTRVHEQEHLELHSQLLRGLSSDELEVKLLESVLDEAHAQFVGHTSNRSKRTNALMRRAYWFLAQSALSLEGYFREFYQRSIPSKVFVEERKQAKPYAEMKGKMKKIAPILSQIEAVGYGEQIRDFIVSVITEQMSLTDFIEEYGRRKNETNKDYQSRLFSAVGERLAEKERVDHRVGRQQALARQRLGTAITSRSELRSFDSQNMPVHQLLKEFDLLDPIEYALKYQIMGDDLEGSIDHNSKNAERTTIYRTRIIDQRQKGQLPRTGLDFLIEELFPFKNGFETEDEGVDIDLLYASDGRLLAIAPASSARNHQLLQKGAIEQFYYFDLTPYYFEIPQVGSDDVQRKWEEFGNQFQLDQKTIHEFIVKQNTVLSGSQEQRRLFESYNGAQQRHAPYVYLSVDKNSGSVESARAFWPHRYEFSRYNRHSPLQHNVILPIFPSVYSPGIDFNLAADLKYYNGIGSYLGLESEHDVLVAFAGSGIDSLLAFYAMSRYLPESERSSITLDLIDANPLAVANEREIARLTGFNVRAIVNDNLFLPGNIELVFGEKKYDRVLANMPYLKPGAETGSETRRVEDLWDGDGGKTLKRFSEGLYQSLKAETGRAWVWNNAIYQINPASGKMHDVVEEILRTGAGFFTDRPLDLEKNISRSPTDKGGFVATVYDLKVPKRSELRTDFNQEDYLNMALGIANTSLRDELKGLVSLEMKYSAEWTAEQVVHSSNTLGIAETKSRLKEAVVMSFLASQQNATFVWTDEALEALRQESQLLIASLEKLEDRSYSVAVSLPDKTNLNNEVLFRKLLEANSSGQQFLSELVTNGALPVALRNQFAEQDARSRSVPNFRRSFMPFNDQSAVPLLILGQTLGRIDEMFIPFEKDLSDERGVRMEDPMMIDYVELLRSVVALHMADLSSLEPSLLQANNSELLKAALISRLNRFGENFENIISKDEKGWTIKGSVAKAYLEMQIAQLTASSA